MGKVAGAQPVPDAKAAGGESSGMGAKLHALEAYFGEKAERSAAPAARACTGPGRERAGCLPPYGSGERAEVGKVLRMVFWGRPEKEVAAVAEPGSQGGGAEPMAAAELGASPPCEVEEKKWWLSCLGGPKALGARQAVA